MRNAEEVISEKCLGLKSLKSKEGGNVVPGADVFWNSTSLGSFIQLKMLLFNKRHLHSGCVQRQTYGRDGEQLVPSNDLPPATTKALRQHLPPPGAPTGSRVL